MKVEVVKVVVISSTPYIRVPKAMRDKIKDSAVVLIDEERGRMIVVPPEELKAIQA